MKKKISKIIVISLSICLSFSFTFINVYAADDKVVIDYLDYITDVVKNEDNNTITVTLPLEYISCNATNYTNNQTFQFNSTELELVMDPYNHWYFSFFPLGDNVAFLNLENIPLGTVITFNYWVGSYYENATNISTSHSAQTFLNYFDSDFNLVSQNQASEEISIQGNVYEEVEISMSIEQSSDYLNFSLFLDNFYMLSGEVSTTFHLSLTSVKLTFNITDLQLLYQESGKTNKLLEELINGDDEDNAIVGEMEDDVNNRVDKGDEILGEMDSLNKPSVDDLGSKVNPFDIVDKNEVNNYTNIFSSLLSSSLVTSLLLISISFSLVSLVLFGKKG